MAGRACGQTWQAVTAERDRAFQRLEHYEREFVGLGC
jgi:hypothetical protein